MSNSLPLAVVPPVPTLGQVQTVGAKGQEWDDLPAAPAALSTSPPAATGVALTSGAAWHNTLGSDVTLYVQVSFGADADSVALALGSTSTPGTSLGTVTGKASQTAVIPVHVPAGWYLKATLAATATFTANANAQPV